MPIFQKLLTGTTSQMYLLTMHSWINCFLLIYFLFVAIRWSFFFSSFTILCYLWRGSCSVANALNKMCSGITSGFLRSISKRCGNRFCLSSFQGLKKNSLPFRIACLVLKLERTWFVILFKITKDMICHIYSRKPPFLKKKTSYIYNWNMKPTLNISAKQL